MGFLSRPSITVAGVDEFPDNLVPVVEGLELDPGLYAVRSITRAAGPVAGSCTIDTLAPFDLAEKQVPPGTEIWVYDGFDDPRTILFHGWVISYTLDDSADSGRSEYRIEAIDASFRMGDLSVFWQANDATPSKIARVLWDGFTLTIPEFNLSAQIITPKIDASIVVMGDDISEIGGDTRPRSWSFSGQSAMQVFNQIIGAIPTAMWWIEPSQEKGEPDLVRVTLRGQGPQRLIFRGGDDANEMSISGRINYAQVRNEAKGYGDRIVYEVTDEDPSGNPFQLLKMWDESLEEDYFEAIPETDPETGLTVTRDSFWAKKDDPTYADVAREWALPLGSNFIPAWKTLLVQNKQRITSRGDDLAPSSRPELWMRRADYELKAGGKDVQWSKVDETTPFTVEVVTTGLSRGADNLSPLAKDAKGVVGRTSSYFVRFGSPMIYNAKAEITEDDGNGVQVPVDPEWKIPEFQVTTGMFASDEDPDSGRLTVGAAYNSEPDNDEDAPPPEPTLPWVRSAIVSNTSYHKQIQINARHQIYANGQPAGSELVSSSVDDSPRFTADIRQRVGQTGKALRDLEVTLDGIDTQWSPGHVLLGVEDTEIAEKRMICVSVTWNFGGDVSRGASGSDSTHIRVDNPSSTAV